MYSKTIIIGNVGRDAEMRYTPTGIAVCDFSVATSKTIGKGEARKEITTWYKVTVWRDQAEVASQYVKKGMRIFIEGEVKASAYIDKDGQPRASLELTAQFFKFLSGRGDIGDHADDSGESGVTDLDTGDVSF